MSLDTQQLSHRIFRVVPSIMRAIAHNMRTSHHKVLSSQVRIMKKILHSQCNLSELAETETVTLPTMSNTISTLVERGWLSRDVAPDDRREIRLTVTPQGLAVLADVQRKMEDRIGGLLRPLSEDDLARLSDGLDVLEKVFCSNDDFKAFMDKKDCE